MKKAAKAAWKIKSGQRLVFSIVGDLIALAAAATKQQKQQQKQQQRQRQPQKRQQKQHNQQEKQHTTSKVQNQTAAKSGKNSTKNNKSSTNILEGQKRQVRVQRTATQKASAKAAAKRPVGQRVGKPITVKGQMVGDPEGGGSKICAFFFPHQKLHSLCSPWASFRGILVVLKCWGPPKSTFGVLCVIVCEFRRPGKYRAEIKRKDKSLKKTNTRKKNLCFFLFFVPF